MSKMTNDEFKAHAESFKKLTVKHIKQNEALDLAMFYLTQCLDISFVVLAGPTGAGKSHLIKRLLKALHNYYLEAMLKTPSMVPYILTLAVADGARKFGWRRLWLDALRELNDPFCDARSWRTLKESPEVRFQESYTTAIARHDFEREVEKRGTRHWAIDEAQHVLLGRPGGDNTDQFDVLKSVCQKTDIKLILCGTYQLPRMLGDSGQVMRRSATVTLAPYSIDKPEEVRQFAGICKSLLDQLPGESTIVPVDVIQQLFEGSLGCVGVLKDWIARSWAKAHHSNHALSINDFSATRLPYETLLSMLSEIREGEAMNSTNAEALFRQSLYFPNNIDLKEDRGIDRSNPGPVGIRLKKDTGPHNGRKPRVGERAPGRDPVATPEDRASAFEFAAS